MKSSLARRLFRTILTIGVINVVVALIAVEFIYEDVEDTILRQELAAERRHLEERIGVARTQSWQTALLSALYVPDEEAGAPLPALFADRPIPFSAEVEVGRQTFLVSIERTATPPGVLYLAQDITLLEDREDEIQLAMVVLALCMLAFGFLLAHLGTRRIVAPLHDLTRHIARLRPGGAMTRIEGHYRDAELADIAATLNRLLDALDAYVRREKALVSMASHELRTPVAVIAGALDVLEQRATLSAADRDTVARIRRAASDMHADIEALLRLARRADPAAAEAPLDLAASVAALLREVAGRSTDAAARLRSTVRRAPPPVHADPALVRMLLRNLVHNALRHTRGTVDIDIDHDRLRISDHGDGLPATASARLQGDPGGTTVPEDGLGLFIVRLICERLQWALDIRASGPAGTVIELRFAPPQASAGK
ncbi:HAMP domain-containing sensor histidine kinase [Pseudothauera lacus]|uniref:histidine kinase n=1 Tax=Pseudothauera lacus TaxID=2136175 RepID=A0A2T4IGG0_9RHOO|nr:HAMP domain-containing sensor histidine kinase [Pseudothauera lacus]PTD96837.1 histidine kinase [Pseudothauera lacus]